MRGSKLPLPQKPIQAATGEKAGKEEAGGGGGEEEVRGRGDTASSARGVQWGCLYVCLFCHKFTFINSARVMPKHQIFFLSYSLCSDTNRMNCACANRWKLWRPKSWLVGKVINESNAVYIWYFLCFNYYMYSPWVFLFLVCHDF